MKKMIALIAALLLALSLTACDFDDTDKGKSKSRAEGEKLTEQAFEQQSKAVPYPADQLTDSLERRNLRERLLRQNDPERIGYVYYVSFGKFLGYWTIKGKVSSTQSQMTPSDDISEDLWGSGGTEHVVTDAPGDDGSYGENEKGVFFFTTEGAMVQVCEECYFYSDQPVAIGSIPELNGDGTVPMASDQ